MSVELETERLRLRQLRDGDLDAYAAHYADEEMARFIGGACGRDDAWRGMAMVLGHWALRGYGLWAVEEKESGAFSGCVGLWRPEGWPELEAGWWLIRGKQGRGYATEAARRARGYAYEVLGARTLVSYIDPDNEPSKRVARRLGAVCEASIELRGKPAEVHRHPSPTETLN